MTRRPTHRIQNWRKPVIFLAAAILLAALPFRAHAFWIYMNEEEAIQIAFPNGERVVRVDLNGVIAPEDRLETERALTFALVLDAMECYQGSVDGNVVGYACIDEVIGRYRPITFMVKIDHPAGKLAWYEILVYREAIGASSRKGPFREQFLGATVASKLKYGVDIRMLVGATLTSNHLAQAFRKHLHLYRDHLAKLAVQPELPKSHFKARRQIDVGR
jgi:hypothetical protein